MSETIFTTIQLSNGDRVDILDGKGSHMIEAALMGGMLAQQNPTVMMFYLIVVMIRVNKKTVNFEYVKSLSMTDLNDIVEIVSLQLKNIKKETGTST